MAQMIRKQIYIAKRQQTVLKRIARARGISEAELIRQAIDQQTLGDNLQATASDHDAWEKALQFMLALRAQGPVDDEPRQWKREDAYEDHLSRYDRRSG
jgi:hypothetical protein